MKNLLLLLLLLTAPALAQGSSSEHALTGLATVVAALILVWRRRCPQLPQYMPGDIRPTLKHEPRPVAPKPVPPVPAAETVPVSAPLPPVQLEFAKAPAPPPAQSEDLVFEAAAPPAATPEPEPEPELDPSLLESQFLELQGQFEEQAGQLATRLEQEWTAMQAFLEAARARLAKPGPAAEACQDLEALGPELQTTADPVPPPHELDGQGWSEPAENGVRSRNGEFLGGLTDPTQPPGPSNPRAYYRERRVEEDGLVFREITRGIVVGRQLQIQESARYPEKGIPSLLEVHRLRAQEHEIPVAYRLWLTRDHAIRVFATRSQTRRLEPFLLELPEPVRARVPDILVARDLGGRTDWEGHYFQTDEGRPATHGVLADPDMLALRHDLLGQPELVRAALRHGLGQHLEPGSGEAHRVLVDQWEDLVLEQARQLKARLYP